MTQRTEQMSSLHAYSVFDTMSEAVEAVHRNFGRADLEAQYDQKIVFQWFFETELWLEVAHIGERWMVFEIQGSEDRFTILELEAA